MRPGAGCIWRRLIGVLLVLYPDSQQPEGRDTQIPERMFPEISLEDGEWRDPRADCGFQPHPGINKVQDEEEGNQFGSYPFSRP